MYKNTCIICEEKGVLAQYFGESSKSAGERSTEHMTDAMQKKKTSHIYQHLKIAHPEWLEMDWNNMFRFEVEMRHKTSVWRQVSNAIFMKNSPSILNLKEE